MTKNTIIKDLELLGFTKNVSKVYLALIELGETKAGAIVKKTGMHRHLVYTALDELIEKKLVSRIQKGGVARFVPLSPEALLISVQQTQELATSIITDIQKLQTHTNTQQVIVYESLKDMAAAEIKLYDLMQPGETQYILGLSSKWYELLGKTKVHQLAQIQNKKKFYIKGIGNYITENEQLYTAATNNLTHFKMIPGVGSNETEMNILHDRILIKVFVEPYTCVEIINPKLARDYKKYFVTLWNQGVRTYTGWDELETLYFTELLEDIEPGDVEYVIGANIGDTPTGQSRAMDFFTRFNTARKEKGGQLQALVYQRDHHHIYQQYIDSGDIAAGTAQVKSLQDKYWSPLVVDIFSTKVVILMMKEEPTATVYSNNVDIIAGFKKQFDSHWEQEVQTYIGWDEIENLLLNDLIPSMGPNDIEYAQGAGYDMTDDKERFATFWLSYNTKRVERGMKRRLMMYEPYRELLEQEISLAGDASRTITELRYLPQEYNSPMETHIYNNKVALIVWQGTPVATVYNRPEMAVSMKNQFEMLWSIAKV